jgi:hypothetical protein
MIPKLTDDAVADLPLRLGRAELLEEIMSVPVVELPTPTPTPSRRGRWVIPLAAAVAVALIAAGAAWWVRAAHPGEAPRPATTTGPWIVLDAPGWTVTMAYVDATGSAALWEHGAQSLELTWYDAAEYRGFFTDRRRIDKPASDGKPVEVLGRPGHMWAYFPREHTVIREVEDGQFFELRGTGMDEQAYLELLGRLKKVDLAGFEAAMPESFFASEERSEEVRRMLDGIGQYVDPLFPASSRQTTVSSTQNDPYQLGMGAASAVACAWFDELAAATESGDQVRVRQAMDVLSTTHDWPVLHEIDSRGYFPEVLWHYADEAVAGRPPADYFEALGCER